MSKKSGSATTTLEVDSDTFCSRHYSLDLWDRYHSEWSRNSSAQASTREPKHGLKMEDDPRIDFELSTLDGGYCAALKGGNCKFLLRYDPSRVKK